jgi:hypothetical protein
MTPLSSISRRHIIKQKVLLYKKGDEHLILQRAWPFFYSLFPMICTCKKNDFFFFFSPVNALHSVMPLKQGILVISTTFSFVWGEHSVQSVTMQRLAS